MLVWFAAVHPYYSCNLRVLLVAEGFRLLTSTRQGVVWSGIGASDAQTHENTKKTQETHGRKHFCLLQFSAFLCA